MKINSSDVPKSALFESVKDTYGTRLALVFGNEYINGECPFYTAKQCNHCDIGAGEGTQFNTQINKERLEFFKKQYGNTFSGVEHLILYNSGSTLNKKEMSRTTLAEILGYVSTMDRCKVVSLDSREVYVTKDTLDYIVSQLREDQQARVILGVESQNDEIRIGKLNKKMTKQGIEKAFKTISKYEGRVRIDINIIFQPPELTGEEAIKEAVETLKYGLDLAEKYDVPVDFNYHPFYQSKRSKAKYPNHPRANLEDAKKALVQMVKEIERRRINSKIFIGWQDEEHDQQQDTRAAELEKELANFEQFNVTQKLEYI